MFNSISNNFGAGTIQFKDVQESNYIVLNAKFTCNPQSDEYKAADVLEITVPALSIDRSAEAAVVVRFIDRRASSSSISAYDGGTVAKSWVKDAKTLCIEKLSVFDDQTELIIYIQTLYCQLAQGGNSIRCRKKNITCVTEGSYLSLSSSYTFCIVFKKWTFYHMMINSCTYAMQKMDWEALFENLPDDITADVPVIGAACYNNTNLGGVNECRLEEGFFSLPALERNIGFFNTSNNVFSFAYLVRDVEPEPEIEGRLHYENDALQASQYSIFYDVNLELIPAPTVAALSGRMGVYGAGPLTYPAPDFPEEIPAFDAFFLAAHQQSNGLVIQMLEVEVIKTGSTSSIKVTDLAADKNLSFKLFDTAIPMAI
ncbi:MAG: hypothetical protein ACI3ZT_00975 [Candidatus Cryptobacteroides sp.]